ncbi:MAG: glycosyltransferase family 4 protein [Bacteroidaceae bacterium]|nr:glycosyltransferase family 4 protein [Bacteroidaceae bacterium]
MNNRRLKKILFCDNTLWGLINFRGGVIEHFVKQGVEVVIVAPEKENAQMTATIPQGVRYIPTVMDRMAEDISSNFRFMKMLLRIYKQERPDVIFHYTIKPNIYGSAAAWLLGIPSVAMITGMGTVFAHTSLKMKMAQGLYKFGLKFAKRVIFLNAENRRFMIEKGFCKEENAVLLSAGEGVDLQKFPFSDNASPEIIFLIISRILKDKGYYEFVEAAKTVKQQHPEVRFQLLGFIESNNPNGIKQNVIDEDVRRGYIEYLGYTHDMAAVYARKGIVVTLPSAYYEGLNRTLMEACATGKPIVTTDIPGCRETVEEGINGFLCKPKDAQSLAAAIEKYIVLTAEDRQKMSAASRKLAEEKFSQDKVIDVYEKIISELV